jgi:hypothetical protein
MSMKNIKIIVVGMNLHSTTIATKLAEIASEKVKVQIVTNNIEAKNIVNSTLESEPLEFLNHRLELTEQKLYNDVPRNKFIDNPRHNFRKR